MIKKMSSEEDEKQIRCVVCTREVRWNINVNG